MTNFFKTPFELSVTKKICLSAFFIVLVTLFNKVIAINYIPVIPFVRLSFGSIALLIFASIIFGPLYGMVIGASADLLGYFVFDASSFGWFFQITLVYALLGFVPFFIYKLVTLIKNEKLMMIIEYSFMSVVIALLTLYFIFNETLTMYGTTYHFEIWQRVLIPSLALVLFALIVISNIFIKKGDTSKSFLNIYQISFVVFISEIIVNFLFGALMKSWAFGFNMFLAIIISQGVLMFFNIPYNTYMIFVIMKISKRFLIK